MKDINQKLKDALNKKHAELRKLQKKMHHYEKAGDVSPVYREINHFLFIFANCK